MSTEVIPSKDGCYELSDSARNELIKQLNRKFNYPKNEWTNSKYVICTRFGK